LFRRRKVARARKRPGIRELKKRYFAFKELLSANNDALLILTNLESKVHDPKVLTMSYLRSQCVELTAEVYKIIRNLEIIAGKSYPRLYQTLERRILGMEKKLTMTKAVEARRFALRLNEVQPEMRDVVGNKTANLAELKNRLGLLVPDGFVLTTLAFQRFYEHNQLDAAIDSVKMNLDIHDPDSVEAASRRIQELILNSEFPDDLADAVWNAWRDLKSRCGPELRVAVRSSAIGEDSEQASFAGLYESYLNVTEEGLLDACKKVLAGKYTTQALYYKAKRGIRDEEVPMCICCMQMVDASVSGVMYTEDPFQAGRIYITAGWGLGPGSVLGEVRPDLFALDRRTGLILEKKVSEQSTMILAEAETGTFEVPVPRIQEDETCLEEEDLSSLYQVAHVL